LVHRERGGLVSAVITDAERSGWQRRAARELGIILNTHIDLPIIAWTLASAGSGLVGLVSGPARASQRREAFDAWRTALRLGSPCEVVFHDGTVVVKASAHRNQVRVTLTTTLPPDHEDPGVRA
jgi:hypothetical protein